MKYKTRRRHYKSLKKYRDFRILIWLGIGCFIVFGLFLLLTNVIFATLTSSVTVQGLLMVCSRLWLLPESFMRFFSKKMSSRCNDKS